MAGATGSDDNMVVGRVNWSDGGSILWAKVPPGETNFNGGAILTVEVAKDYSPDDGPDDYEDGASFVPSNRFNGIEATGWSGGSASSFGGTPGAVGVIGRGGRNQGTGVRGLGGGTPEPENGGAGGIGVHGLGGPQAAFFADPTTPPGAGMVAQGGRQDDKGNTLRLPHAAGMIAIGGGTGPTMDALPVHTLMETGGVGVYGQGAEQTITLVPPMDASGSSVPGPDVPSGPSVPGSGVLGRGGVPTPPTRGPVAAGVVGLAGGTPVPDISETGDTGVAGHGPTGVRGRSDSGNGVSGVSDTGRGGTFESAQSAQVQLVPQKTRVPFPVPVSVAPTAIPVGQESLQMQKNLPADGRGGDLLVLMDEQRQCTLWFCVHDRASGGALWAEVLLGKSFEGQR